MKKAFTMIELLMVIIVVGVLAAVALPRFNQDSIYQAANQIVSHIRYTQHLAMQDDKFNPNDQFWYRSRWQIRFCKDATILGGQCNIGNGKTEWGYSIFSDSIVTNYNGNPEANELAVNPQNPTQFLTAGYNGTIPMNDRRTMKALRVEEKFGIKNIIFSQECGQDGAKSLAFDGIGRPLYGHFQLLNAPYARNIGNRLLTQRCTITLCTKLPCPIVDGERRVRIAIEPETGYVHIL